MKRIHNGLLVAIVLLTGISTQTAAAQGGPPPYVRDALDSIMAMLQADDDASINTFVADALTDSAYDDPEKMEAYLATVRDAVKDLTEDVGLEFDGQEHMLILRSGRLSRTIAFDPTPNGITSFRLLDPTEAPIESPRDRAIRDHTRAIEAAVDQDLETFIQTFERDHFAPVLKADIPAEERRRLLTLIHEAAASSGNIGLNENGESVILILDSATVTFEVEAGMSKRMTTLSVRQS